MFPSLVSVGWRLSPLFYEDAQIVFFPAPISYLGEQYIFPQRMPPGHNLPRRAIPGPQRHSLPLP